MKKIKTGVIGAGFMGTLHCKAYAGIEGVEFAGVYDAVKQKADEAASKYDTKAFYSLEDMIHSADAISIAAPTTLHYSLAMECLKNGKHLLIEKPIAATVKEAEDIAAESVIRELVVGVGFIERFNPAVIKVFELVKDKKIKRISASRMAPPSDRANDVSVVFDLMIHDLDIISSLVNSDVKEIKSQGKKKILPVYDDVSAQIVFKNGITADVASNKVSDTKSRILKIECEGYQLEADLISKIILVNKNEKIVCEGKEPIKAEVEDFINAVNTGSKPCVSAQESLSSIKMAWQIENGCK